MWLQKAFFFFFSTNRMYYHRYNGRWRCELLLTVLTVFIKLDITFESIALATSFLKKKNIVVATWWYHNYPVGWAVSLLYRRVVSCHFTIYLRDALTHSSLRIGVFPRVDHRFPFTCRLSDAAGWVGVLTSEPCYNTCWIAFLQPFFTPL